jgi:CDP-diglyceride synthetase
VNTLAKRLLTAIVAIPAVLFVFWLCDRYRVDWGVFLFLSAVAMAAGWEYLNIVAKLGIPLPRELFMFAIPAYLMLLMPWEGEYALVLAWAVVYLIVFYSFSRRGAREGFFASLAGIFGLLYIPVTISFVYLLYKAGFPYVAHVLLMVWGYDAGAYLGGSAIGRHQVLPRISLAKTWEGVVGGLVLTMVGAALLPDFWTDLPRWLPHIVALGAFVGAFCQLGDLFESLVKRAAGVKDTSRLFPGHGGMLDRIDSLLAALPVYYFYMHYILGLI